MKKPQYIYCLEGNWNTNPRSRQSVRPILELLHHSYYRIKYVYRRCNTKAEFFEYIRQYTFRRYDNYTVLYIAFHGRPNKIVVGREEVALSEIADVLEGYLSGRVVHFGSCSTLRTKRSNIDDFLRRTKADVLSGYRQNVDFVEASALEMTLLKKLCSCLRILNPLNFFIFQEDQRRSNNSCPKSSGANTTGFPNIYAYSIKATLGRNK